MSVDYATYCCEKDSDKLQKVFYDHLESHNYKFDDVHLIYQRWSDDFFSKYPRWVNIYEIQEEDYSGILSRNGINPDNPGADEYTHGWKHSHYWRHHCVNHLVALEKSTADYIVLSDADCYIKNQRTSWVTEAIGILKRDSSVLVVSPGDGSGKKRITQNMSQQMFLCDRKRLQGIDFDLPFTGFKEGGPMQEYYFMLEGRIGRYMEKHKLWRCVLGDDFRYWHKQWR